MPRHVPIWSLLVTGVKWLSIDWARIRVETWGQSWVAQSAIPYRLLTTPSAGMRTMVAYHKCQPQPEESDFPASSLPWTLVKSTVDFSILPCKMRVWDDLPQSEKLGLL